MSIPNFSATKPMSQFGPHQTMAQGYSSGVTNALPAFQQAQAMERQNPLIGRQVALQGLINRPVQGAQQYQAARTQAQPVLDFAGYQARQQGTGNAGYQETLQGMSNPGQYAQALQNYGNWKDAETKRANASGMLSSGFGAMLPGLAMLAFPAAGLANVATGAAMGGITGGPAGALLGGLSSAVAPRVNVPSGALRAPVQAAKSIARQFSNPVTAGRQALASALGSRKPNNA